MALLPGLPREPMFEPMLISDAMSVNTDPLEGRRSGLENKASWTHNVQVPPKSHERRNYWSVLRVLSLISAQTHLGTTASAKAGIVDKERIPEHVEAGLVNILEH